MIICILVTCQMLDRLSKKEMETWAMTAWSLWTARNKFHFEQVQTPPTMIFRRASSLLDKYQQLMAALPSWQALLACLSLIYRLYILYLFLCIFFLYSLSPSRWLATALAVLFCLPSVGFCRVLFFFSF